MTNRLRLIEERIQQHFSPSKFELIDEGYKHIGHAGAKQGGHFRLHIAAEIFNGKAKLECHRLIYSALDDLMKTDIHALSIHIE